MRGCVAIAVNERMFRNNDNNQFKIVDFLKRKKAALKLTLLLYLY
tara:strand:+ start:386 stop:520 length:135 start_codon:yes stop_codon:yes gene_type:complete